MKRLKESLLSSSSSCSSSNSEDKSTSSSSSSSSSYKSFHSAESADVFPQHEINAGNASAVVDSLVKKNRAQNKDRKIKVSLALPGGGIRSSAFGHGILESLSNVIIQILFI